MTAGARNRRITIQRATVVADDHGGEIETWGEYCKAWARVIFQPGQERREAAQEQASAVATFSVLANSLTNAVKATERIVFDGSDWDVVSNIPSRQFHAERDIEAVRLVV